MSLLFLIIERGPPSWLFPFGIVIGIALAVLITGLIYLAVFGTKKGFNIHVWNFYESQQEKADDASSAKENSTPEKMDPSFDNLAYES